jgi:hypothetical protein
MPPVTVNRTQGNIRVDGFGVTIGEETRRLDFPRAEIEGLEGESGSIEYGAGEVSFEALSGRLQGVNWSTQSASASRFWVRDKEGRFELHVAGVELPRGVRLTRSAMGGVELVAPHASFTDLRLHVPDLTAFRKDPAPAAEGGRDPTPTPTPTPAPAPAPAAPAELRQEHLRFLDAINGAIGFTIKVVLDLPVLGIRTLDQKVQVEIKDGAFDYKKLDDGLTWLEGAFLDIEVENNRFRVAYGVPLLSSKEIISFALDNDASAAAAFDRISLRSLADFRIPGRGKNGNGGAPDKKERGRLRSLTLGDLAVNLHMVAPRNLEAMGGTIRFGGDDAPGIVDLDIAGSVVQPGSGQLTAKAGAVDMTIKDAHAGGLALTADRLHVGPMDELTVTFDGFTPRSVTAVLHRVTATNLSLILGGSRPT